MIEVHFFDYGCGFLDVEKELGIAEDVDVWLCRMVPGLRLEATDSGNDMEDNAVYWFSAAEEKTCCDRIQTILRSRSPEQSKMQYTVKVGRNTDNRGDKQSMSDSWQMNYDEAASHWLEKDRDAVHLEPAALREKIDAFLRAHNTGALATAGGDLVRCTPIEYNYVDGCLYLFSEGGLKFRCLKDSKRVGFAVFEPYGGFGQLKSLQITGTAEMVEPFSEEYQKLLDHKKIPADAIRKLPKPMNLIKIMPESFDYLDSDLKKDGFGSRQHLE